MTLFCSAQPHDPSPWEPSRRNSRSATFLNDRFMITSDIEKAAQLIRARDGNMVIIVIVIIKGAADA